MSTIRDGAAPGKATFCLSSHEGSRGAAGGGSGCCCSRHASRLRAARACSKATQMGGSHLALARLVYVLAQYFVWHGWRGLATLRTHFQRQHCWTSEDRATAGGGASSRRSLRQVRSPLPCPLLATLSASWSLCIDVCACLRRRCIFFSIRAPPSTPRISSGSSWRAACVVCGRAGHRCTGRAPGSARLLFCVRARRCKTIRHVR